MYCGVATRVGSCHTRGEIAGRGTGYALVCISDSEAAKGICHSLLLLDTTVQ